MKFNLKLEHIRYVKMFLEDSVAGNVAIKCNVRTISKNELICSAKFDDSFNGVRLQRVKINIVCDDGLYKAETRLKRVESSYPYIIYYLEVPDSIEFEQKREFFRIDYKQPCTCFVNIKGEKYRYDGEILNLSANGVCAVFLSSFVPVDSCDFIFTIENKTLSFKVNYIRSEKYEGKYKVSFSFEKLTSTEKDFISQICIKKQLEQRRKNLL